MLNLLCLQPRINPQSAVQQPRFNAQSALIEPRINSAAQAVSEALNKNVKKTEWDAEFQELLQQTDATKSAVEKILKQVPVFLHPNPAARASMAVGTTYAKLRKTAAEKRYPHPVGELSEMFLKHQDGLAPDSPFGQALRETGEVLSQINEASHSMVGTTPPTPPFPRCAASLPHLARAQPCGGFAIWCAAVCVPYLT